MESLSIDGSLFTQNSRTLIELIENSLNAEMQQRIQDFSEQIIRSIRGGGKVLIAGNGGSAAEAQHMAAEFVNYFRFPRPGLPAVALTTDSSILTSISNDSEYERVFARQIEAIGQSGDVFWGYTTSGTSKNILKAAQAAKSKGLCTVVFCGQNQESLLPICDLVISVPSSDTPRIQEVHTLIGHTVSEIVEQHFFGEI